MALSPKDFAIRGGAAPTFTKYAYTSGGPHQRKLDIQGVESAELPFVGAHTKVRSAVVCMWLLLLIFTRFPAFALGLCCIALQLNGNNTHCMYFSASTFYSSLYCIAHSPPVTLLVSRQSQQKTLISHFRCRCWLFDSFPFRAKL